MGTMIAVVNDWVNLPAGRYLVRCRIAVDQVGRCQCLAGGDEVYGSTPAQGQFRLGWGRWMGVDFTTAGAFQNLDTPVDLPVAMAIQPRLYWRGQAQKAGDIRQIHIASVEILPPRTAGHLRPAGEQSTLSRRRSRRRLCPRAELHR